MMINNLNLIQSHNMQSFVAACILGLFGLVLTAFGIYAIWNTSHIKNTIEPIKNTISVLENVQHKYLAALDNAPLESDIEKLSRQIEKLSSKLSLEGSFVSKILYELETTLPDNAYIMEFEYPYEDGIARILLLTQSEQGMSQVLQQMEANNTIGNVVLSGQSRQDNQAYSVMADIQFSMR